MSAIVERFRDETGWHNVREQRRSTLWQGKTYYDRVVEFVPDQEALPTLYIVFDDQYTGIAQFGMGEWHTHPEELDDAIAMAKEIVAGRKCVLEERANDGTYSGSGPVRPMDVLTTLRLNARRFQRMFFNRGVIHEPIDFGRYQRGKHLWMETTNLAEAKRTYAELGIPFPIDE